MAFQITDTTIYKTVQFKVKNENGKVYYLSLTEHDWHTNWEVKNEGGDSVQDDELIEELVFICQKRLEEGI